MRNFAVQVYPDNYENIVEKSSRSRRRFRQWAMRDVAGWLVMMWLRWADQSDAAARAESLGNKEWAASVAANSKKFCDVIQDLIGRVHHKWSAADWIAAQQFLDTMTAAKDDAGNHLHALGNILSPERVTDVKRTSTGGGEDIS